MGFTIRRCKVHNRWQFHVESGFLPCCLYTDLLRMRNDMNGMMQARSFIVPSATASRREIAEQTLNLMYQIGQQSLQRVPARVGKIKPPKDQAPTQPVEPQPEPNPTEADVKSS